MKILIFLFYFFFFQTFIFSQIYFEEIDFDEDLFIEIYSDNYINLSDKTLYDENNFDKLSLIKNYSSTCYLLITEKFTYDFNLFNCSIYSTLDNSFGSGLRIGGENITIEINNTFNLTFISNFTFDLEDKQTLHYNFSNNSYYISGASPNGVDIYNLNTNSNETQETFLDILILNEYTYGTFKDNLQFSFDTNLTDFTIYYWIENSQGNTVKELRDTQNLNSKSYTPSSSEDFQNIHTIFAKLYDNNNNLLLEENKTITLYSDNILTSSSGGGGSSSCDYNEEDTIDSNYNLYGESSIINITNKDEILKGENNILKLFLYKSNDTAKRTTYINLNGDEILKVSNMKKFDKCEINLPLSFEVKENNLTIEGLDKTDKINLNISQESKILKKFFKIKNINLFSYNIKFDIEKNIEVVGECYTLFGRKRVSDKKPILKDTISLNLDRDKIANIDKKSIPLEIYCKYKEPHLKTNKTSKESLFYKKNEVVQSIENNNTKFLLENENFIEENKIKNEIQNSSIFLNDKILESENNLNYEKQESKKIVNNSNPNYNQNFKSREFESIKTSMILFMISLSILSMTLVVRR